MSIVADVATGQASASRPRNCWSTPNLANLVGLPGKFARVDTIFYRPVHNVPIPWKRRRSHKCSQTRYHHQTCTSQTQCCLDYIPHNTLSIMYKCDFEVFVLVQAVTVDSPHASQCVIACLRDGMSIMLAKVSLTHQSSLHSHGLCAGAQRGSAIPSKIQALNKCRNMSSRFEQHEIGNLDCKKSPIGLSSVT